MNLQEILKKITSPYFDDAIDYRRLSQCTGEYQQFLIELTEVDLDNRSGREDITGENGIAIGTLWAAMCIDDMMRTRQFIRGIYKAIIKKRE